jgi:hypothetical protein
MSKNKKNKKSKKSKSEKEHSKSCCEDSVIKKWRDKNGSTRLDYGLSYQLLHI